jgi:REP element-mobilizing transposase RayT
VTFSTWQRRRLFVVESYVRLFLKTLYGYRRDGRYQLHAFVLMPEHVHLLLTPASEVTFERAIQLVKGGYSHALGAVIGRKSEVWQRGFTDHRIRDEQDFFTTGNTFIRILLRGGWLRVRLSIATAPPFPGSSWTAGPQRLKPHYQIPRNRHEWNSCPSQFYVPHTFRYKESRARETLPSTSLRQASSARFIVILLLGSY